MGQTGRQASHLGDGNAQCGQSTHLLEERAGSALEGDSSLVKDHESVGERRHWFWIALRHDDGHRSIGALKSESGECSEGAELLVAAFLSGSLGRLSHKSDEGFPGPDPRPVGARIGPLCPRIWPSAPLGVVWPGRWSASRSGIMIAMSKSAGACS